jgi:membrane-associated phospholipid phosphatase
MERIAGRRRLRLGLAAGAAAAFSLLAALVVAGVTNPLDRYAAEHWMLELSLTSHPLLTFSGLMLPNAGGTATETALAIWRYPASLLVSSLLLAGCAYALHRRGHTRAAVAWCITFAAVNAIELTGKIVLSRPTLRVPQGLLPGYDHSFPSGHTVRALVVAAAIAFVWPRLRWPALVWGLTVPLVLVALSDHVPTDVVGGALLVVVVLLIALPALTTFAPPSRG